MIVLDAWHSISLNGLIGTKESFNVQNHRQHLLTTTMTIRTISMNHMNELRPDRDCCCQSSHQNRDQTGVRVELEVTSIVNELGTV